LVGGLRLFGSCCARGRARSAERLREQLPRLFIRVEREALFHLPLVVHERQVRLADAVMRALAVFAIEQDVTPGLLEGSRRESPRVADGPQRLGLHQALGGSAVQRCLKRRRCRAVFPVGRVAADGRACCPSAFFP
jgi:hypothetical protein